MTLNIWLKNNRIIFKFIFKLYMILNDVVNTKI